MGRIFNMLGGIFGWGEVNTLDNSSNGLYLLNDPSTPDLAIPQTLPQPPALLFSVRDFQASKLNSSNPADINAVNCYITICNSINYFQTMLKTFDRPVDQWAATSNLTVIPSAGTKFNAFYDRQSLQFFSAPHPTTRKMISSAASNDVVTHELGHAFLDVLRPDLWNIQSLEIWAFHEAFGDINSIVHALHFDQVIIRILEETNGSLLSPPNLNSNLVTKIGEEMAGAVFYGTIQADQGIRDVSEKFVYINPNKLPQKTTDNKLSANSHSFSRVFSGAWYEILVRIFERERSKMGDIDAIKYARDIAYSRLLKAIKIAPSTNRFLDAVAKCMLSVETMKGGIYSDIIESVFTAREIMRPTIKILSNVTVTDVLNRLSGQDIISKKGDHVVIRRPKARKFRISDHWVVDLSSSNPVYDAEMEVPGDSCYIFDNKQLVEEIHPEPDEILQSAVLCALSIKNYQGLGAEEAWDIKDGKLVRNHIICHCQTKASS